MKDFGYSISKGRTLNYDNSDFSLKKTLVTLHFSAIAAVLSTASGA